MSIFKKALVAAAALASVNAFAAIAPASSGNGELTLTVYDATAKVSYVMDLGVTLKDFANTADLNRTVSFEGVAAGVSAAQTFAQSWVFDSSAGSEFAKFAAAASASSNWRWAVAAGDATGTTLGARSVLTTVTAGATYAAPNNNSLALVFSSMGYMQDNFLTAKGDAANQNTSASSNGSVFGSVANGQYVMDDTSNPGETMAGNFSWGTTNALSDASSVVVFYRASSAPLGLTKVATFDDTQGNLGQFSIQQANGSYQLNYTVGAVPEPGSYALMLAGLGAVGMLARRRRQA